MHEIDLGNGFSKYKTNEEGPWGINRFGKKVSDALFDDVEISKTADYLIVTMSPDVFHIKVQDDMAKTRIPVFEDGMLSIYDLNFDKHSELACSSYKSFKTGIVYKQGKLYGMISLDGTDLVPLGATSYDINIGVEEVGDFVLPITKIAMKGEGKTIVVTLTADGEYSFEEER